MTLLLASFACAASGAPSEPRDLVTDLAGGERDENGDLRLPNDIDDLAPSDRVDAWNRANDPGRFERFGPEYVYEFAALPREGAVANTPWSGYWWPRRTDGTNRRWAGVGTLSPLEKYDAAFHGWTPDSRFSELSLVFNEFSVGPAEYYASLGPAASWMTRNRGTYVARNGIDDDGDGDVDEHHDYDGIAQWRGLCHAWSAAAILEPAPLHAVTMNGQTFEREDIKALVVTVYDYSNNPREILLGQRCNRADPIAGSECRDVNAGAFHVVLANLVGRAGRSFVADMTVTSEVWNYPVISYRVISAVERRRPSRDTLGPPWWIVDHLSADTVRVVVVTTELVVQGEQDPEIAHRTPRRDTTRSFRLEYVLELDRRGKIIGGVWNNGSVASHPDFLWLPNGRCPDGNCNPHVSQARVRELLERSRS